MIKKAKENLQRNKCQKAFHFQCSKVLPTSSLNNRYILSKISKTKSVRNPVLDGRLVCEESLTKEESKIRKDEKDEKEGKGHAIGFLWEGK